MKLLLTDKAKRFPPIACRLLARHQLHHNKVAAMSDSEIADRSQLSMGQVKHISWSLSWDEIPFGQMIRFLRGCGIDFDDRDSVKRNTMMMNGGTFLYMRKSPLWESQLRDMAKYWRKSSGK
jgi:hypothetical protein